ncbi:MAG: hypothetical protein Q8Q92_02480 [bacterium]|nr:hypothetical protein [bacterium]
MERQKSERRDGSEGPNQRPGDDEKIIIPVIDDKGVPKPEVPISPEDLERILREQGREPQYKNAGNN